MKRKIINEQIAEALEHFIIYIKSPLRIIWLNLLAGLFRGLGALLGVSLVIAALFWILGFFTKIPLIGNYFNNIKNDINYYIEKTNYKKDLNDIQKTLDKIQQKLPNNNQK